MAIFRQQMPLGAGLIEVKDAILGLHRFSDPQSQPVGQHHPGVYMKQLLPPWHPLRMSTRRASVSNRRSNRFSVKKYVPAQPETADNPA